MLDLIFRRGYFLVMTDKFFRFIFAIFAYLSVWGAPGIEIGKMYASAAEGADCAQVGASLKIGAVLDSSALCNYVDIFNDADNEIYKNEYPNARAKEFLAKNIPLLDCPDKNIESVYYFRWWTYRKHIAKSPEGWIVTEFMPKVPWGGKYNIISCPAGFHVAEGRWLKDKSIISDYLRIWMTSKNARPRAYTFAAARAAYDYHIVAPDAAFLKGIFGHLKKNSAEWEKERRPDENYLFWQYDNSDGMECSIAGALSSSEAMKYFERFEFVKDARGYRVNTNSYMYADFDALSKIAKLIGEHYDAELYRRKADTLKDLINTHLWDSKAKFYKTRSAFGNRDFADVRELNAYSPWMFSIAPDEYAVAWLQLTDKRGFKAPFGPTTAEQRHKLFRIPRKGHECQWSGASWPYSTSATLVALGNLLNECKNPPIGKGDFYETLSTYARSHRIQWGDGSQSYWIDESLDPYTGEWITRSQLMNWDAKGPWNNRKCKGPERGKDYNHSEYCDIVITALIGFRPLEENAFILNPMVPDQWEYFCLDNIYYKGKTITVFYDKNGGRYNRGAGLIVLVDGKRVFSSPDLKMAKIAL